MKRKLSDLGKLPRKNLSVGDLKTELEEALWEREERKLSPRLLGPEELNRLRNEIIHQRHASLSVPKVEADGIVGMASDLVREIFAAAHSGEEGRTRHGA